MLDAQNIPPHSVVRWARETPDNVAIAEIGGPRLTYAELDVASRRWAGAFQRVGVGAEHHVATMLPTRIEAQLALLGLAWLRAIEVPVNIAHRGTLLRYTLDFADVTVLVVDATYLDRLAEVAAELPTLHTVILVGDPTEQHSLPFRTLSVDEFLEGVEPAADLLGPQVYDTAALLFTSGTTGPSKAVISPWGVIYAIWSWVPDDAVQPGEGIYCALPMFHNSGRSGFINALDRGGRFVFREKFSASNFLADVRSENCVIASLVGPMSAVLYATPERPDDADNPLRAIVLGPMVPDNEGFKKRFDVKVGTAYGQTETGCPISTDWDHGPVGNCGRVRDVWPFVEARIVDEHDNELPPGEVGEFVVRAREPWGLNVGYYKMPDETVAAWRNGWFHSGDALRVDKRGNFFFIDRMKDTIRRRGENISSFEVEVATAQHPAVGEAAAVAVDVEHGDQEVLIFVVPSTDGAPDPAELHRWLQTQLPKFMVPRFIEVVDDLPRNATTQRVIKTELRSRGVSSTTWEAPR